MNQEPGAFARHDLFQVRFLGAVTLPDLFGAALLGRLAKLRGDAGGIDQFCAVAGEAITMETNAAAMKGFISKPPS